MNINYTVSLSKEFTVLHYSFYFLPFPSSNHISLQKFSLEMFPRLFLRGDYYVYNKSTIQTIKKEEADSLTYCYLLLILMHISVFPHITYLYLMVF